MGKCQVMRVTTKSSVIFYKVGLLTTLRRVVLSAVPLLLEEETGSHDFPRSWLLPVLKDHIEATELSYFRDTMMPLADSLGAKGT